ncbi:MAG: RnfABCDGE type electron transport complex subunit G [Bacteriovoracaceae bacterium]|nr:RnfABCDGE type electron transport complex subunit G [Bacteriovoracaceae bacterium]
MKNKGLQSTFFNMVIVLFSVALVSSASLGFVYNLTKDKIAQAKAAKQLKAIEEVILPGYDNSPADDAYDLAMAEGGELECFPAKLGDEVKSIAVKTFTKNAFSGEMWLMVGFLPDGTINKISIVDQKETPGLGTKVTENKFKSQFAGKNPGVFRLKVKKDGGDVDAITAATVSSRAVCDAVERAYKAFLNR